MNEPDVAERVAARAAPAEPDYDPEIYRTLLESTKAIPWKIDWSTMRFSYIGPQIEALLGWRQDSWVTVEDWASRMHPDDREAVVNFCVTQSQAGVDHEADYRAMTIDNDYVWIRDVVHVVRKADGAVESLVGFMFDISDRKKAEQALIDLQKELEAFSYEDGLTGIPNRRMFDTHLETMFDRATRSGRPISMIMLDIDHFKSYNDHYGHIQGDVCLRQVAAALQAVIDRPEDMVARYGGEEFIVLLPEADESAALHVAHRCSQALADLQIPHQASASAAIITASLGVGTIIPSDRSSPMHFIQSVDQLLYAAKRGGRNRIVAQRL